MRSYRSSLSLVALTLVLPASISLAAEPPQTGRMVDPDWPCPQRRVAALSSTQLWDGPPVEGIKDWSSDGDIRKLIDVLASRRVPQEEAVAKLKEFADKQPAGERDAKLTKLFAGLLDTVNRERAAIISGIMRFEQRQHARSAELEREGTRIGQLKAKAASDDKARAELDNAQQLFDWNVRIFQERQSNTPIACEIPVLIESRIFEMARAIRQLMSS